MNKIILKIIALGLFLSGCGVFKDVENTAKPLNTTPVTVNKKPPPPTEANFPVTDAIDNIANARSVLADYLGQEDSQVKPTDLPDVQNLKKKIRQVKTENILRLNKNGESFLSHLAGIGDDTERSSIITEVSDGLDEPALFTRYVNESNIMPELLAKKADQSLREVMSRAGADINNLELPDDNESKEYLVSLTTDPVITDKIVGPNKEAFADTIIASVHSDNDKKNKILANLKNGSDPAQVAKIEDKQVDLAQNILDDATENIEKIGNLDAIKNSIGDPVKKAHIEDKQVALAKNILAESALSVDDKAAALNALKPSLPADKKQEIEVAQVTDIFSDEAKLLDPDVLIDEASKNNLLTDNKVKSDLFKVGGNRDNLVGFYVAKLDKLKKTHKSSKFLGDLFEEDLEQKEDEAIFNLKTKINPANNDEWRKIIETSPYLKGTYFDADGVINDKQTAELLDYKIEANEVIAAAQNLSIKDLNEFLDNYYAVKGDEPKAQLLKGLLNNPHNNFISSLANRDIADKSEAIDIIKMLVTIDNELGNDLNNNLPENETPLLTLLKNNIAKPEIFNSLYEGLTNSDFHLADDTEAAFRGLISGGGDIVGELAKADMSNLGKVDEVIKTLDILVDASGGKDKFNQALLASKAHKVERTYPNLEYLISPIYKLLEKDMSNKIAHFCLQNDIQMINDGITVGAVNDMIYKPGIIWIVQDNLKHLLMNNDATRDVYLKSYASYQGYTMKNDYTAYIDFVLADSTIKIEDKFGRIKKAARSVYNHNSNSTYRNNAIGDEVESRLVKNMKGYFKNKDKHWEDEPFKKFIGTPSYFWSYGKDNFYNIGETYQELKGNVW